ncbi:L,D-transpeptidase [Desmonostoc muscorum LEGE 12446]|uniref:L,D-transpeptidase n=1 Tax=Desmonostoc muscorum LEGE 12446 TaxID=1828758 RepID=A0A8J6ZY45_DESMC|nr:L,D-transpeptidase [Desmonostoc muscorum]MCF2147090.1 L,D-transpeptidase [Desmonostoc muscorum LEGE 12446]
MTKEPPSKTHLLRQKILIILLVLISGSLLYLLLVRLGLMVPVGQIYQVLCLQDCQPEIQLHTPLAGNQLLNYDQSLEQLVTTGNNKKISLLIEKSKHRLTVYNNLKPLKSYPVVFGSNPVGDKQAEGDSKTPEGILRIKDLYPHPQWSKFLWLDYPNVQSWRNYFQAKITGKLPWYIPIGGELGIHGVPVGRDKMISDRYNWTLGCPSLKNKDVDELYQWVQKGTVVEILP